MRKQLFGLLMSVIVSSPAMAALPVGSTAPDFVTNGALGGKPFQVHLKNELKKGPVVLYFYPKAFTQGCTLEAHAFSDATRRIQKGRRAGYRNVRR